MGHRGPARGALALIVAAALAGGAGTRVEAQTPATTYRLEAADGAPGAVHASFTPDRPGRWRVRAAWSGRALAGLRVENTEGHVVKRIVGSSPLAIELVVDDEALHPGEALTVRFAPTTDRGALTGELRVIPPEDAAPKPAPPSVAAAALNGPGAVLAPAFGEDAAGRAVRDLAQALETASAVAVDWTRRWAARLVETNRVAGDEVGPRGAFDGLWEGFLKDAEPDPHVGAAFRRVLAAVEDLTRRELRAKGKGDRLRARRAAVVAALARFAPPPAAPPVPASAPSP